MSIAHRNMYACRSSLRSVPQRVMPIVMPRVMPRVMPIVMPIVMPQGTDANSYTRESWFSMCLSRRLESLQADSIPPEGRELGRDGGEGGRESGRQPAGKDCD